MEEPGYHHGKEEQWQPTVREELVTYMLYLADGMLASKEAAAVTPIYESGKDVDITRQQVLAEADDTYRYLSGLLKEDFLDTDTLLARLGERSETDAIAKRLSEQLPSWIAISGMPDPDTTFRIGGSRPQNITEKKSLIEKHTVPMGPRPGSQYYDKFLKGNKGEILGLMPVEGGDKPPIYIGTVITKFLLGEKTISSPVRITGLTGFDTFNGKQGLIIKVQSEGEGGIDVLRPNEILELAA